MREYVVGDMFDIASRVKDIDPALDLSFDFRKKVYVLTENGRKVMTINPGELDSRILVKIREGDLNRRRLQDFILDLERSEDEVERQRARELRSRVESMTLDNYDRLVGIPHFSCGHW